MSKKKPVIINLGCNRHASPAFINVDMFRFPGVDVVADLREKWPFPDNYADRIIAVDLAEHLPDRIHFMNECWRVLKPGGIAELVIPSTDGRGADQDPTHVSFWNLNSFFYYAVFNNGGVWQSHPWRSLYAPHLIKAAFSFMPPEGEVAQTEADNMGIVYLQAKGKAIKDPIFSPEGLPEASTAPLPDDLNG